ncbi:MAG TPA: hypothetical protein DEP45_07275, partial [Armatimonadetes bacterium]|nr:hypothetical protein [Armatimonadota bacterium]
TSSTPWRWTPFVLDACYDQQRNVAPLELPTAEGTVQFERGVGMGVPFALKWTLGPAGVYARVVTTVGLHPASAEGTQATFVLLANGEEIARTEPVAAGAPCVILDAPLPMEGDAIELTLETRLPEGASGAGALAVWGEPRLVK